MLRLSGRLTLEIFFFSLGQQDVILKLHFKKLLNQIVLLETVKKKMLYFLR